MTNKDPSNYVLFKDFYFYSILANYVFYFWFLVSVLLHYDDFTRTDYGTVVVVFDIIVIVGTFIVLALSVVNKDRFPYPLAGIIFILLLVELAVLFFYYDKRDLDPEYARDPVSIGISFLLAYAFVSYFTC
tara:strand:+ start:789 stop:1181 length:393 start_codon:yes stop_codon:yes gene_type:complete